MRNVGRVYSPASQRKGFERSSSPTAEAAASEPALCRFESCLDHCPIPSPGTPGEGERNVAVAQPDEHGPPKAEDEGSSPSRNIVLFPLPCTHGRGRKDGPVVQLAGLPVCTRKMRVQLPPASTGVKALPHSRENPHPDPLLEYREREKANIAAVAQPAEARAREAR